MSYDLFFYKKKNSAITIEDISEYLSMQFPSANSNYENQWLVENTDTETYFSIEYSEPDMEKFEDGFEDFENTRFTFNLNYIRPDFFGQFAFAHISKFIGNLDLYVLDPQFSENPDIPFQPKGDELYRGC